jgi:hypothetical protein
LTDRGVLVRWGPMPSKRICRGSELIEWLCSPDRRSATPSHFQFPEDKEDWRLPGRPRDVCQWRGFETWEGWRQLFYRVQYFFTGYDPYAGARATASLN